VVGSEPFMPASAEPLVIGLFIAGVVAVIALEWFASRRAEAA
jgi:hypothetical protein